MIKKVVIPLASVSTVVYGLLYAQGSWWVSFAFGILFGMAAAGMISVMLITIYWSLFAEISREKGGSLRDRVIAFTTQQEGETPAEVAKRGLASMVQLGVPTLQVVTSYSPPYFLFQVGLSVALILAAVSYGGWVAVFAFALLVIEVIAYNCIHWLRKNRKQIATDVKGAADLLLKESGLSA